MTEPSVRSSRVNDATSASAATGVRSRCSRAASTSRRSSHVETVSIVPPARLAASSRGARSLAARDAQNSWSACVEPAPVPIVSAAASARASSKPRAWATGSHTAQPSTPGATIWTVPSRRRADSVLATRSPFTLAASTGPRHPATSGAHSAEVFPDWVGPTTSTEPGARAPSRNGVRSQQRRAQCPSGIDVRRARWDQAVATEPKHGAAVGRSGRWPGARDATSTAAIATTHASIVIRALPRPCRRSRSRRGRWRGGRWSAPHRRATVRPPSRAWTRRRAPCR